MTSLVVGGGISGLVSAYFLAKAGHQVTLVERNAQCGGLLRSFDYGEFGKFDYGAHNILELGIAELDELFWSLWPEEDWQVTLTRNGQTRALTGLIYQNTLQHGSPFIDLRAHPKWSEYVAALMVHLNQSHEEVSIWHNLSAKAYSEYLFGEKITADIISPALLQLHNKPAGELNAMVLFLTQFTRLVMFDEPMMLELLATKRLAKRLSYPDQLNLPESILNLRRSLYPRKYGIYRVIEALQAKCEDLGVTFLMNAQVAAIEIASTQIAKITVQTDSVLQEFKPPKAVFWTAGLMPLANLMQLEMPKQWDRPAKTLMSHFLFSQPLNAGQLSFIYDYDAGSKIFRIDNYTQYCEGAPRAGGYPVTVESLMYGEFDATTLRTEIIQEMQSVGLLADPTDILFATTEVLDYGFPMLSQRNVQQMNQLREAVQGVGLHNLEVLGVLAKPGLFFESDVLVDTMQVLKKYQ